MSDVRRRIINVLEQHGHWPDPNDAVPDVYEMFGPARAQLLRVQLLGGKAVRDTADALIGLDVDAAEGTPQGTWLQW